MQLITGFHGDTYYESFVGKNPSKEAVVFLHGYPADQGNKNRDLAEAVSTQLGKDAFLLHYPGLGLSKGKFTFSETLRTTREFLSWVKAKNYQSLHIVGHSWGGFLALNLLNEIGHTGKIVLLSPFVNLPEGSDLSTLVNLVYSDTKQYLGHSTIIEVVSELTKMRIGNSIDDFIVRIDKAPNQVTIIQALNDPETPEKYSRYLISKATKKISYTELDTDHSFTQNRTTALALIINTLRVPND